MAIYTINSRIVFDDQSGSLSIIDDVGDPAILAAPATRLLSLLIKNNNKVMTRDEILTEVWEKHGLVASSNNLYHYVSVIRKSMASVGENNIIVTLPKIGFTMKAVSVAIKNQEQNFAIPHIDDVLDKRTLGSIKFSENKHVITGTFSATKTKKIITNIIFFSLIVSALIASITMGYVKTNGLYFENKPLAKIQNCRIYPLQKHSANQDNKTIDEVKFRIDKYKLDCSENASVYYSNEKGYILLYYCTSFAQNIPDPENCYNIIVDDEVSL